MPYILPQDNGNRKLKQAKAPEMEKYVESAAYDYTPSATTSAITEERLMAIMPELEQYYELWLSYPDKLVDLLLPKDTGFKLLPFQILDLRVLKRHTTVFKTACRGYSKSFVMFLDKFLTSILLPRSKVSALAPTRKQGLQIGNEKVTELQNLMPLLRNEINREKGSGTQFSKEGIDLVFHNKSQLMIDGVGESARGGRRHNLGFEEIKDHNADAVNNVALPLLNISRRTTLGELNTNEPHQSFCCIGSAGFVGTFAYEKNLEILADSILNPSSAFCYGGTYKVPQYYGLLNKNFVKQLRLSPTFDEASFAREYLSIWSSTVDGAEFDYEVLTKRRVIAKPEFQASLHSCPNAFYIGALDVARTTAASAFLVIKCMPQQEFFKFKVVYLELMQGRNFTYQASRIKELDMDFDFREVVVDANGLGAGLIEFFQKEQMPQRQNQQYIFPAWNVVNAKQYKDFLADNKPGNLPKVYAMKTNQSNAGLIHGSAMQVLGSSRLELLNKEENVTMPKGLSRMERFRRLEPHKLTSRFLRETCNLAFKADIQGIKLEKINKAREKDFYSAFEYGIARGMEYEKQWYGKKKKKYNGGDLVFG